MVNMIDSEKVIKHLISQFCDQQFKFTINLKILGSIHVIVDNNEVLTCLLDEKYFKPNARSGLIIPNNSFNPSSNLSIQQNQDINTDNTINLVNTLHQLQQQQQCSTKMSVSTVTSSKLSSSGVSSKSSSSAHSSGSSSSSSSYISSVYNDQSNQDSLQSNTFKHKRKRFDGKNDSQPSCDSLSIASSKKEADINSENEHDAVSDDENNTNHENVANPHLPSSLSTNLQCMPPNDTQNVDSIGPNDIDSSFLEGQTPVKRNKLDTDYESHNQIGSTNKMNSIQTTASSMASDEAVASAAATLSLISVASRTHQDSQQQNNQPEKTTITTTQGFTNKKSKIKSIIEEYNKNEQFQLQLQLQQEQARVAASETPSTLSSITNQHSENNDYEQDNIKHDKPNESNSSDDQLYMDEGNQENNVNEYQSSNDSNFLSQNSAILPRQPHNHQDHLRQQHQLMMAAAAAIINNNNSNGQQTSTNEQDKILMPHLNLALNLAVPQQQQHQQNAAIPKKKKQRQNSVMSPSSSTTSSSSSTSSKYSTKTSSSTSSASSISSLSNSKKSKNQRQTIAALAASTCTQEESLSTSQAQLTPSQTVLQRNLATIAQHLATVNKEPSGFDKIIYDMNVNNDKSKLLTTHTPQPAKPVSKLSKKQHLLNSRSANNSPKQPSKTKLPKSKKSQFQDTSNLPQTQNLATSQDSVPTNQNLVAQAQNLPPYQTSVAQAAAAAVRYQQLLSQVNNSGSYKSSQMPKSKYLNSINGNQNVMYPNVEDIEDENQRNNIRYDGEHEDEVLENDESENGATDKTFSNIMQPTMGAAGSLNFKSLNNANLAMKQEPLTNMTMKQESLTNMSMKKERLTQNYPNQPNLGMAPNLEFECTACDKKFKYYCYYKRHMDACHSDMPKYVCDTCDKSYKWEASFRQHLRLAHVKGGDSNVKDDILDNEGAENQQHSDLYQNLKMSFENNENHVYNDENKNRTYQHSENDYNEYDEADVDVDSQENETGVKQTNEAVKDYVDRDTEQMGAAGALASIATMMQMQANPMPATTN